MNNIASTRRVRRPRSQEGRYKELTQGDTALFDTYKNLFMLSATIGYYYGVSEPFDTSAEQIHWPVFKELDRAIIDIIALESSGYNFDILLDGNFSDKLNLLEEYANAGFKVLDERLAQEGDPLDNLIYLLFEGEKDTPDAPDSVEDVLKRII